MVQLLAPASELPQVLVWLKSPGFEPKSEILLIVNAVLATLLSVTVCAALGLPTGVAGKLKLDADNCACVPVPISAIYCGLSPPLSPIAMSALRVPPAVGVNTTLILQLLAPATEVPQLLLWLKSAGLVPMNEMLLMVIAVLPRLVSVTA